MVPRPSLSSTHPHICRNCGVRRCIPHRLAWSLGRPGVLSVPVASWSAGPRAMTFRSLLQALGRACLTQLAQESAAPMGLCLPGRRHGRIRLWGQAFRLFTLGLCAGWSSSPSWFVRNLGPRPAQATSNHGRRHHCCVRIMVDPGGRHGRRPGFSVPTILSISLLELLRSGRAESFQPPCACSNTPHRSGPVTLEHRDDPVPYQVIVGRCSSSGFPSYSLRVLHHESTSAAFLLLDSSCSVVVGWYIGGFHVADLVTIARLACLWMVVGVADPFSNPGFGHALPTVTLIALVLICLSTTQYSQRSSGKPLARCRRRHSLRLGTL